MNDNQEAKTGEVVHLQQDAAPLGAESAALIQVIERAASNPDIDVEKMERLLDMQERIMRENAKRQFDDAMRTAQIDMPRILRDKENPSTHSMYSRLETINNAITPIYTRLGFSLSFGTDQSPLENHYRITCDISHVGGHRERKFADVPADSKGMKGNDNKTATHAFGSTMSYGRRYLTLLIFNLTLVSEDDDGVAGGAGPLFQDKHVNAIYDIIKNSGLFDSEEKIQRQITNLARAAGKDSLTKIPLSMFETCKAQLEAGLSDLRKKKTSKEPVPTKE